MRTLLRRASTVPQRTTCNVLFIGKFSRSFQNPVSVNFNSNGTNQSDPGVCSMEFISQVGHRLW